MKTPRDSRPGDLGYAAEAVKPFEDLSAYELARRVRVERAAAVGDALATLIIALARLPARLLGLARGAARRPANAPLRS